MATNVNLDSISLKELNELATAPKISKSKLIRKTINNLYLKEKRAKENLLFFVGLYNKGTIDKNTLFILLPRKDAEAIIIGSKTGKEAVEITKGFDNRKKNRSSNSQLYFS